MLRRLPLYGEPSELRVTHHAGEDFGVDLQLLEIAARPARDERGGTIDAAGFVLVHGLQPLFEADDPAVVGQRREDRLRGRDRRRGEAGDGGDDAQARSVHGNAYGD